MPNKKQEEIVSPKDEKDEKDEKKFDKKLSVADDMMAELEAFAPSKGGSEIDVKKSEKENDPENGNHDERDQGNVNGIETEIEIGKKTKIDRQEEAGPEIKDLVQGKLQ